MCHDVDHQQEHTFEVSLFSELFNEMLMRDFGALVYRSVMNESLRKEKRDKKEDDDSEKKRKKLGNNNAPLLLAYCYFDLSHCNYIASKDLEDLFLTLGLQLSRAQVITIRALHFANGSNFMFTGEEITPKSGHG